MDKKNKALINNSNNWRKFPIFGRGHTKLHLVIHSVWTTFTTTISTSWHFDLLGQRISFWLFGLVLGDRLDKLILSSWFEGTEWTDSKHSSSELLYLKIYSRQQAARCLSWGYRMGLKRQQRRCLLSAIHPPPPPPLLSSTILRTTNTWRVDCTTMYARPRKLSSLLRKTKPTDRIDWRSIGWHIVLLCIRKIEQSSTVVTMDDQMISRSNSYRWL